MLRMVAMTFSGDKGSFVFGLVFLLVACNLDPIGPGVSYRDSCKDGGFQREGKRSERDLKCSAFLVYSQNSANESKFNRQISDLLLLGCVHAQIKLNKCDKKSPLPKLL